MRLAVLPADLKILLLAGLLPVHLFSCTSSNEHQQSQKIINVLFFSATPGISASISFVRLYR
jgi:hypothetical protein